MSEINRYTVNESSIIVLLQTYNMESETHSKKFNNYNKKCNLEDIPFIWRRMRVVNWVSHTDDIL